MIDHVPRRRVLLPMLVVLALSASAAPALAAATDTDRDGLPDTFERTMSLTDPRRADTDRDGLKDGYEDPDHDGLTNRQEYIAQTHPRRADTDRDGIRDDREDPDRDGPINRMEFLAGTHPLRLDTDRDGLPDGSEDPDRDGLTNRQEQTWGTLPRRADTDGDGYLDGGEVVAGTNPRDAASHPVAPSAGAPTVPGADCSIFPATNVWNVPIDGLGVAADSATLIATIGLDRGLHMDFGSYAGYGIPYQVVSTATPRSTVVFDYADESDHVGYPIPASPFIEGGSDRHLLMVDRDACRLFELFAARKVGSTWHAGSGATWDLGSNALRPQDWTSADAAGLPILPGLVRHDEVMAGAIAHALRFTTNQTRTSCIYPARHQAGASSAASLPPMGLRVRLKASVDISGLSPAARTIAQALKTYGMILADNGSPWYVSGASDPRFDDDVLHELGAITGHDLEVVDTSGLVNGP
jgi:Bacterial TSP3 repeat